MLIPAQEKTVKGPPPIKVKYFEVDFWINLGDFHDFNTYIYWQNFFSESNYLDL